MSALPNRSIQDVLFEYYRDLIDANVFLPASISLPGMTEIAAGAACDDDFLRAQLYEHLTYALTVHVPVYGDSRLVASSKALSLAADKAFFAAIHHQLFSRDQLTTLLTLEVSYDQTCLAHKIHYKTPEEYEPIVSAILDQLPEALYFPVRRGIAMIHFLAQKNSGYFGRYLSTNSVEAEAFKARMLEDSEFARAFFLSANHLAIPMVLELLFELDLDALKAFFCSNRDAKGEALVHLLATSAPANLVEVLKYLGAEARDFLAIETADGLTVFSLLVATQSNSVSETLEVVPDAFLITNKYGETACHYSQEVFKKYTYSTFRRTVTGLLSSLGERRSEVLQIEDGSGLTPLSFMLNYDADGVCAALEKGEITLDEMLRPDSAGWTLIHHVSCLGEGHRIDLNVVLMKVFDQCGDRLSELLATRVRIADQEADCGFAEILHRAKFDKTVLGFVRALMAKRVDEFVTALADVLARDLTPNLKLRLLEKCATVLGEKIKGVDDFENISPFFEAAVNAIKVGNHSFCSDAEIEKIHPVGMLLEKIRLRVCPMAEPVRTDNAGAGTVAVPQRGGHSETPWWEAAAASGASKSADEGLAVELADLKPTHT